MVIMRSYWTPHVNLDIEVREFSEKSSLNNIKLQYYYNFSFQNRTIRYNDENNYLQSRHLTCFLIHLRHIYPGITASILF